MTTNNETLSTQSSTDEEAVYLYEDSADRLYLFHTGSWRCYEVVPDDVSKTALSIFLGDELNYFDIVKVEVDDFIGAQFVHVASYNHDDGVYGINYPAPPPHRTVWGEIESGVKVFFGLPDED